MKRLGLELKLCSHKCLIMVKFCELKYELLECPVFTRSDYYLFSNEKNLFGKCYTSNNKAIATVHGYFTDLGELHFNDGIIGKKLE